MTSFQLLLLGRRVKNILGLVRDKGVEASSNTVTISDRHARAQEFLSFPKAGWISLADCKPAQVSLSLSMGLSFPIFFFSEQLMEFNVQISVI